MLETIETTRTLVTSNSFAFEVAHYEIESLARISVRETLALAEQFRRAAIKHRIANEHSEAIVGKTTTGAPLIGHSHAHYFSIDEDSDSQVDHFIAYAPRGFDDGDLEALMGINSVALLWRQMRVPVKVVAMGNRRSVDSSIFALSKRWRSVTPFSLPRFPNRGGGKPPRPRDLPEAQLAQELVARGLPEPISIKRIEGYQPALSARESSVRDAKSAIGGQAKLIRWAEFHTQRFKGTQGKGLAGFEIEFAEPVAGPIAVGFGCHFGLGLFMPW